MEEAVVLVLRGSCRAGRRRCVVIAVVVIASASAVLPALGCRQLQCSNERSDNGRVAEFCSRSLEDVLQALNPRSLCFVPKGVLSGIGLHPVCYCVCSCWQPVGVGVGEVDDGGDHAGQRLVRRIFELEDWRRWSAFVVAACIAVVRWVVVR